MPRIAGNDIPANKRIVIALTYIYGIGKALSQKILKDLNINESVRAKDLHEDQLSMLGAYIEKNFSIEGQLRRQEMQNIVRMKILFLSWFTPQNWSASEGQRTRTKSHKKRSKDRGGKEKCKRTGLV